MLNDLNAANRLIDEWESSLQRQAEQAKSFAQAGAGVTATVRDKDGIVEITVDSAGGVTAMTLSERIRKEPAADTADRIMRIIRAAQAQLAQKMAELAARTMDEGSDTARAVANSYSSRFPSPGEDSRDGR